MVGGEGRVAGGREWRGRMGEEGSSGERRVG